MATRKVKLEGIGEWCKVFEQNREMTGYKPTPQAVGAYEECNGACKIDVIMNDVNFKKLKDCKSMKSGTDDELGRVIMMWMVLSVMALLWKLHLLCMTLRSMVTQELDLKELKC